MNVFRFRQLLRVLLLTAGPGASAACSLDGNVTDMPDRAQCVDVNAPTRYAALTLAPGIDGIAFATRGEAQLSSSSVSQRLPALGVPCAGARDRPACEAQVNKLLDSPDSATWSVRESSCGGCQQPPGTVDLGVITTGDEVRLATFLDVIRAAAPIDGRDEAAAVMALRSQRIDCNDNNVRRDADGWTFKTTTSSCSGEVSEYFTKVTLSGETVSAGENLVKSAKNNCIEGRRPANLTSTGALWLSSLPACFSEIAHMEAAAVLAFDVLAQQLQDLGAPAELQARVARAKQDEVAHTAVTSRLAHRFGATPPEPSLDVVLEPNHDSLALQVALENAVEGCVREAYGALVAAFQASHAQDPEVRAAFAQIAIDEAEHAELSFAIDAWLATQLTPEHLRRVDQAKTQAWLELAASCDVEPAAEVVSAAGMPTAEGARAILAGLTWAAAQAA